MNNMFGIENIKIRTFETGPYSEADNTVNKFLEEHNGNIIDIKYQKSSSVTSKAAVMVIYVDKKRSVANNGGTSHPRSVE